MSDVGSTESPRSEGIGSAGAGAGISELTFEEAQRELDAIVERLERGDADVDELTKLWERGEELYRICAAKLEAVHGRIEELARQGESESASSSPS